MADIRRIYGGLSADIRRKYGEHRADIRQKNGGHTADIQRACAKNGCVHTANIRRTYAIMIFRFHNKHKADIAILGNT